MSQPGTPGLRLRSKGRTYGQLAGVVAGILVIGLAIPYTFGVPLDDDGAGMAVQLGSPGGDETGAPELEPAAGADDPAAGREDPDAQDGSDLPATEQAGTPAAGAASPGSSHTDGAGDPQGAAMPAPTGAGPSADAEVDAGGSGGDAPATAQRRLTATDRGVTEDRVRIGFLLLDTGGVGRVGIGVPGIDPAEQQEAWQAYVDELNERGGIHGRLIEPVYRSYDVLSQEDMRRACLALTQDARVFAVVDSGGFFGGAVLCVTDENETPFVMSGASGIPSELFTRSNGRLFTTMMGGRRVMANLASELEQLGALRGKTLGILVDRRPGQPETAEQLETYLARFGHEVAHTAVLSEDLSVGSSEIPVAVQQMRSRGVDGVFLLGSFLYGNQFVQTADSQRYHPDYFVGDWNNATTDTFGQGMPDSYDGAIGITVANTNEHRVNAEERADSVACRQTYTERTGKSLERGQNQYGTYVRGCVILQVVEAAATRAGPELTRERFTAALRGLGEVGLGDLVAGSFARDKPDAADFVRTLRWRASCRCYLPEDDFRRARF